MWNYTEKMMEYFKNPKNVGEIENPDAVGEVGSIVCGDALKLTLRIDEKTHKIIDAKFKTFGCASAIASSSVLTEMIKGKTLEEASKITNQDIADYLGGLPEQKMHCSVMGMEALEAAIENYYTKKGVKRIIGEQERVVCKCFNVTEKTILKAIELNNLKTVDEVTHFTKAGGGCGGCKGEIEKIIKDF
ncbi:MAG TPA: Fe-S cluster assembly protein NifU [Elusimicrobiales bacterium]|nr:Fe-S cluster assembly protein NifU [Elusimicrobiales bacterium]